MFSPDIKIIILDYFFPKQVKIKSLDDYINFLKHMSCFYEKKNTIKFNEIIFMNQKIKVNNLFNFKFKSVKIKNSKLIFEKNISCENFYEIGECSVFPDIMAKSKIFESCKINKYKLLNSNKIEFKNCSFETNELLLLKNVKKLKVEKCSFEDFLENQILILKSNDITKLDQLSCDAIEPIFWFNKNVSVTENIEILENIFEDSLKNYHCLKKLKSVNIFSKSIENRSLENVNKISIQNQNLIFLNTMKEKINDLSILKKFHFDILNFKNLTNLRLDLIEMPRIPCLRSTYIFLDSLPINSQDFQFVNFFPKLKSIYIFLKDILSDDLITEFDIAGLNDLKKVSFNCFIKDNSIAHNETIEEYTCGTTSFFENILEVPKNCKSLTLINCDTKYLYGLKPGSLKKLSLKNSIVCFGQEHSIKCFFNLISFSCQNSHASGLLNYIFSKEKKIEEINMDFNSYESNTFRNLKCLKFNFPIKLFTS